MGRSATGGAASTGSASRPQPTPFGRLLRYHRNNARLSQLQLSGQAEISSRHLSFMENGRSKPSREMVVNLAGALGLAHRDINALLQAAGFAPLYRRTDLNAPEMAPYRDALLFMLARQEPYPAILVDRYWNLLRANEAAARMMMWLFDGPPPAGSGDDPPNVMKWLFDPEALRPYLQNWEELAAAMVQRVHRDVLGKHDERMAALLSALLGAPGVPPTWRKPDLSKPPKAIVPMTLTKDGVSGSFFSLITTLGTAQDLTLQEIHLETFFPADDATDAMIKAGWTPPGS